MGQQIALIQKLTCSESAVGSILMTLRVVQPQLHHDAWFPPCRYDRYRHHHGKIRVPVPVEFGRNVWSEEFQNMTMAGRWYDSGAG